jgi:hypothetical protein
VFQGDDQATALISELQSQVEELEQQNQQLLKSGAVPGSRPSTSSGDTDMVLLQQRCSALENELSESAKRIAKSMSELKTKLMRKDMLLRMNNITDDDDESNKVLSRPASRHNALTPISR